jgi:toxin YoeB
MNDRRRGRTSGHEKSPAASPDDQQAILHRDFRHDLTHWIGFNPRIALRVMRLVDEVIRNPFSGLGKPEPLKYGLQGGWSRRITEEDRMEYSVGPSGVYFRRARYHYRK